MFDSLLWQPVRSDSGHHAEWNRLLHAAYCRLYTKHCTLHCPSTDLAGLFATGPYQCSFCKYPQLHLFIKWQQKTTARQNLYRTISLHINGGRKIYLNRDLEKPGSFDHFPKGEGCTPWFFRISADNKLNCALHDTGLKI